MRILVVSGDNMLAKMLEKNLTRQRHVIDIADDVLKAWQYLESSEYELILLSLLLPEINGIGFCEKMRSQGYTVPILLVTGKGTWEAGIKGLDAGADDYISKPINIPELHARIRALSRRKRVIPNTVLQNNGLILDPTSCQVSYRAKPIPLTAKEYSILELFLRNPKRLYSRSQILDLIWTFENPPSEESVKTHIQGLRKKLRQAGAKNWIKNIYGIGYILNPYVTHNSANSVAQLMLDESRSNISV